MFSLLRQTNTDHVSDGRVELLARHGLAAGGVTVAAAATSHHHIVHGEVVLLIHVATHSQLVITCNEHKGTFV